MLEIERKFLVRDDSYKSLSFAHSHIVQGYICSERGRTVRVRIRDNQGFITIKGPSDIGGGGTVVTIGTPFDTTKGWSYDKTYGGEVYGACRGLSTLNPEQFSTSIWTQVNIKDKATIMGNVYGGGDNGIVKKDTDVKIGGTE